MIRVLKKGDTISTGNFGVFCPYYYWDEEAHQLVIGDTAEEMIVLIPKKKRILDPVACLSLLRFNYILGDRTLIQGLKRMPWHASLDANGNMERRRPIPHGHRLAEPDQIAAALLDCLQIELSNYVDGQRRVWILLSGGLDSRITGGVLHKIQNDFSAEIHALTWGIENSRDVFYARQIAKHFGWAWHHLHYDEGILWDNVKIAAEWGGAEVAGAHLHSISQLSKLVNSEDVVIASSWGDSIGRAEFNGQHLLNLAMAPLANKHWLIHRSISDECLQLAEGDRKLAWCTEPDCSRHIVVELDSQENYMRRMISHAMNYVLNFCRLQQSFTSDETVSTMWSYSPICRQAEVYHRLFEKLDHFLFNLPWARTGIAPSGSMEKDLSLKTAYHEWGRWLRQRWQRELKELICDGGLSELGVFNMSQVHQIYSLWRKEQIDSIALNETMLKLASIELLRRRFDLVCPGDRTDILDSFLARTMTVGKKYFRRIPVPES
jgi:asparagine synthase (glutamine-hydrolysing)